MLSKNCETCWKEFFKKVNTSKLNWNKSKYCCKYCCCIVVIKIAQEASKWKLTEEQKNQKPYLFKKWQKSEWSKYLKKYRDEWWEVWNKWNFWYQVRWWYKWELRKDIRSSRKNLIWKNEILKRDNYKCVECWKDKINKWDVEVHHIKPFIEIIQEHNIITVLEAYNCPEFRDTNNWISLCKLCHKKYKLYHWNQYTQ